VKILFILKVSDMDYLLWYANSKYCTQLTTNVCDILNMIVIYSLWLWHTHYDCDILTMIVLYSL